MSAPDILAAIKAKYPRAAIVPELTIDVPEWHDVRNLGGDNTPMKPFRRIDALMLESLQRTAIEIKISTADWKRESVSKFGPWKSSPSSGDTRVSSDLARGRKATDPAQKERRLMMPLPPSAEQSKERWDDRPHEP